MSDETTTTFSTVALSTSPITLVAKNNIRKGLIILNTSAYMLFICVGSTASSTNYTYAISCGCKWTMPTDYFTDAVSGVWGGNDSKYAMITEVSHWTPSTV